MEWKMALASSEEGRWFSWTGVGNRRTIGRCRGMRRGKKSVPGVRSQQTGGLLFHWMTRRRGAAGTGRGRLCLCSLPAIVSEGKDGYGVRRSRRTIPGYVLSVQWELIVVFQVAYHQWGQSALMQAVVEERVSEEQSRQVYVHVAVADRRTGPLSG